MRRAFFIVSSIAAVSGSALPGGSLPPPASTGGSLAYFGFYSANISVNAPYSNLYQASSLDDAAAAHAAGMRSLLLVFDAFFVSAPNALVLRSDYAARWAAMAAAARGPLAAGWLLGFNLGDELVWNCLSPTNLTVAADTVRATFPRGAAIIWYNEATPPLEHDIDSCGHTKLGYSIPPSLDWFSTDIYHVDGIVAGWVASNVRSFFETKIYPRLAAGQLVMLVPGSFGSDVNHYPNGTYVCDRACYDRMCAFDASDFFAWASTDPLVVAIMPWNWQGCPSCNGSRWTPPNTCCMDELGTDVQPLSTAAWAGIGAKIIAAAQPTLGNAAPAAARRPTRAPRRAAGGDDCGGHTCSGYAWYPVAPTTSFSATFDVPGMPTAANFSDPNFTYYIYTNIFFPNFAPPGSRAVYNQFVPQLMLGDALSGSSGPPSFDAQWSTMHSFHFQSQYFFALTDASSNATIYKAVTGATHAAAPGERLWTNFSLDAAASSGGGAWTLAMGVVGDADRTSTVLASAPFMGLLAPATARWDEAAYAAVHVNSCYELYGTNSRGQFPSSGSDFEMLVRAQPRDFEWWTNFSETGCAVNCSGHPQTATRERHNASTQSVGWRVFW